MVCLQGTAPHSLGEQRPHHPLFLAPSPAGEERRGGGGRGGEVRMDEGGVEEGVVEEGRMGEEVGREEGERERKEEGRMSSQCSHIYYWVY